LIQRRQAAAARHLHVQDHRHRLLGAHHGQRCHRVMGGHDIVAGQAQAQLHQADDGGIVVGNHDTALHDPKSPWKFLGATLVAEV
jgi:hypothetical protein